MVPGSTINSWDSWFIFNLRKINTCSCMTYLTHEKSGKRMLASKHMYMYVYINNVTTVTLDVGFQWYFAIRLAIRLKILFMKCTQFEQCTYLGFVLLEAPREYVLHGPLLSIYWLRLCPHLGPRLKPRRPGEVVYSPNDSCSHFTQRLFPLYVP
jgi:hypothetical protein